MRAAILIAAGLLGACQDTSLLTPACTPFDKVATEKLSSRWENWEGADVAVYWRAWLAGIRREAVVDGAPASVLALSIRPYPTTEHITFDIRGWRIDGAWRMERRKLTGLDSDASEGPWQSFALSDQHARRLDALLADDCFWSSPRFLPSQVPVRGGPTQTYFHEPFTLFEVRAGEREWGGAHELMAGAPGQLVELLMFAAYPDRGWVGGVIEDFEKQTGDGGMAATA